MNLNTTMRLALTILTVFSGTGNLRTFRIIENKRTGEKKMKKHNLTAILILFITILFFGENVAAQQNTLTYPCIGVPQYFSVPFGVAQLNVVANGGDGDNGDADAGGRGARVSTTLTVTPGQLLTINVGCQSGYGFPRGGEGSRVNLLFRKPFGGGTSSILIDNNFLMVGGGGGSGAETGFFIMEEPGDNGGDAIQSSGNGGRGGGSNGGTGGIFGNSATSDGGNGRKGAVGEGGGGGGGYNPSGGGGASYTNPLFASNSSFGLAGNADGNGSVTISYTGTTANQSVFNCSNSLQSYTVPPGVRQLVVSGIGADGGDDLDSPQLNENGVGGYLTGGSGRGAGKTAMIPVIPGEVLTLGVGCKGNSPSLGSVIELINPGGAGGFGFVRGGRGGDGDKPPFTTGAFGGVGGGGGSGIGRGTTPIFVAAGGGAGGGGGGFQIGCNPGLGGVPEGRNGGDTAPCVNRGLGGITGGGNANGGSGCTFCSSGGDGASYIGVGGQLLQTINTTDYRQILDVDRSILAGIQLPADGILLIAPVFTNISPPVVTPIVNPPQPDGNNGWYRTNVGVVWQVVSNDAPITSQTGCTSLNLTTDTVITNIICQATNIFGTTSGLIPIIKRDATQPNITAIARNQDGTPYVFGTATLQPVIVTYTCTDARSGVAVCPPPQNFSSNGTATGTAVDNAGNTRTVNFGNVISGNQPPTISPIADINLPINTMSDFINFTIGDDTTPTANLLVTAVSANENVVVNSFIFLGTGSNPANRNIRIRPASNRTGTTLITVTVRDQQGATASRTFLVSVNCGTITLQQGNGGAHATYGGFYDNNLIPTGVAPFTIRVLSGTLPFGLYFSPDFSRIFGDEVTQLGTFPISFLVTDANGCTGTTQIDVIVDCFVNYTVTTANDFDSDSLRFAVAGACPNSIIDFAPVVQNRVIPIIDQITINKPLTIQGPGANNITLSKTSPPDAVNRIFDITNGNVTVSGLTLTGGNTQFAGGAIRSNLGNLTVRDSVITGSFAGFGGGSISNEDATKTLTVINSTVSNNSTGDRFSLGNNGGGIRSLGPVNIVNSTVSGNTVRSGSNNGGGIYAPSGTISNSTITNNVLSTVSGTQPNSASGVFGGSNTSTLTVCSSIIAGNQNNTIFPDVVNFFTSGGYNLIGNTGIVSGFNTPTDQRGTSGSPLNPMLNILGNYGGTTPTHSFLSTSSPAIDKANRFGTTTDQRGLTRPFDNPAIPNASGGDGSDIGAFEAQPIPTPTPTSTPTPTPTATPTPTPTGTVSGRITYINAPTTTAVPNTTLNAAGSIPLSTMTDANGFYSLSGFGSGAYTITPAKANQVNGISNLDASRIAQHIVGLTVLNSTQLIAADTSGNGTISALDAAYIAQFVASIPNPGATGTWKFIPASRSYPSVMGNQTNEDFSAILMGEVTGNWNPSGAPIANSSTTASNPAEQDGRVMRVITVTAEPVNQSVGENEALTVNLTSSETDKLGILGYQFDLLYDRSVIEPQAIPCDVSGTISGARTAVCAGESGVLKVVVFGAAPLSGAGSLLKLKFKVIGRSGAATGLSIRNFMFNEGELPVTTIDGQIFVTKPSPGTPSIGGQLFTAAGLSIEDEIVILTDSGGEISSVRSNEAGYYQFNGVAIGEKYTLSVGSERYRFTPQEIIVTEVMNSIALFAKHQR